VINDVVLDNVGHEHHVNGMEEGLENVLVLTGVESIFFLVATMGLCFGFVLKTVFITQGCFSCC